MARLARLTVPGYPHHVIQRGNNGQLLFVDDADRRFMLQLLEHNAKVHDVALHGYVLMGNHFHLLATPSTDLGVPKLLQGVGRRYVRHFNDRHGRTGTLFEGRYRSTLLQADRYLLACMVSMDLNPVLDGVVATAADWAWSSHRHYAGVGSDRLVTPHPLYWALGNTPFAREQAYVDLVAAGIAPATRDLLTDATFRGWAAGDPAFLAQLDEQAPRRSSPKSPGRPRKTS